jgi:hypothetical protein
MSKFEELPKGLIFKPGRGWFIDLDKAEGEPRVQPEPIKEPYPLTRNVRPKRRQSRETE